MRIVANNQEVVAVHAKLQEVCSKQGDMAEYLKGWDDERVQREVAPRLIPAHIARMRLQFIGPIIDKAIRPAKEAEARLESLEGRVDRLSDLVAGLYAKLGESIPEADQEGAS